MTDSYYDRLARTHASDISILQAMNEVWAHGDHKLFLGDLKAASDGPSLSSHHIKRLVNCMGQAAPDPLVTMSSLQFFRFSVSQWRQAHITTSSQAVDFFRPVFAFLEDALLVSSVLVHCAAGANRSAAVVVAFLVWKQPMSVGEAIENVKRKRPIINVDTFIPLLLLLEDCRAGSPLHDVRERDRGPFDAPLLDRH